MWRDLIYPLGFIANFFFTARFLYQWIYSESQGKSTVTKLFWQLSLTGNAILLLHSLIQLQLPIALIQGANSIISWRNLNLMEAKKAPLSSVIATLFITLILIFAYFGFEGFLSGEWTWVRVPKFMPWEIGPISPFWHVLGTVGVVLFSSRFWVQWWQAEHAEVSYLGRTFWWLSLIGAALSIFYFLQIGDLVNLVGPMFGIIPYTRNLMLLRRRA